MILIVVLGNCVEGFIWFDFVRVLCDGGCRVINIFDGFVMGWFVRCDRF